MTDAQPTAREKPDKRLSGRFRPERKNLSAPTTYDPSKPHSPLWAE